MQISRADRIRFINLLKIDPVNDCYIWLGEVNSMGEAMFRIGEKNRRAAIVACLIFNEEDGIEYGKPYEMTCENPDNLCVNPEHLEFVKDDPEKIKQNVDRIMELLEVGIWI